MPSAVAIDTPRLRLRPLAPDDLEPLWSIWSRPPVREHLITRPETIDDFRPLFEDMRGRSALGAMWVVTDRVDGAVIGRCGFYAFGAERTPELAFLLAEPFWGAGLATEAAMAAVRHGFDDRAWPEIVALTRPANVRSARVLEKLGLSPRETIEIKGLPARLFGIAREAWTG